MMIVVTATRMATPLSEIGTAASVVSDKLIQSQQIRDVTRALREVPSVQVTQTGSPGTIADVSIRGATPRETLIMIDGVPGQRFGDQLVRYQPAHDRRSRSHRSGARLRRCALRVAGDWRRGQYDFAGRIGRAEIQPAVVGWQSRDAESGARLSTAPKASWRTRAPSRIFRPAATGSVNDNSDNLSGSIRLDYHLDENTVIRGFARYTRANVSLANFSNFDGIANNPNAHQRNEFMLYKGEIDRKFGDRLRHAT